MSTFTRRLERRLPPIAGGRRGAGDRGRSPKILEVRRGRLLRRSDGTTQEIWSEWKATARPPWVVRSENRTRNRRSRAARKANR